MNLMTWTRRTRPATRRRRAARVSVELIEERVAPSPTLPLPPPHVLSTVATFAPPDPCARLSPSFQPPDPCVRLAPSIKLPDARLDLLPDPI
jgi:hypothetical protein